uniref:Hydroxymethylbilane synthase n=1 Tax=Thermosporothrix sp. COM3 TaxID=2490863 RepID=A0A455T1X4_9CHLR|nr:porphobilinogen deaminase [Thermosporothrix sp. COM3]
MIQTNWIIERLRHHWPTLEIRVQQIHTTGDKVTHLPLTRIGGDGVFVTEIERALRAGEIDLAVHSLKDLPTAQPEGLRVVVTGPREDVRDVLISREPFALKDGRLQGGKERPRIGTCSLRRTAQILHLCPEAEIVPLRGNVDTRLRKLEAGAYDAILLASAGLHRLQAHQALAEKLLYLPVETLVPAPGQGALGLEIRDEPAWCDILRPLQDMTVQATTTAERMFMRHLGAGCYLPVAAHALLQNEQMTLSGLVTSLDGRKRITVQAALPWTTQSTIERAEQLGIQVAELALKQGAGEIIAEVQMERER